MSTKALDFLLNQARIDACDHPCQVVGHDWQTEGGRGCPTRQENDEGELIRGCEGSQTVYRCQRCGQYDYGEKGGPGWHDCQSGTCNDTVPRRMAFP